MMLGLVNTSFSLNLSHTVFHSCHSTFPLLLLCLCYMQESPVLTSIPETNLGAKGKGVKGDFNFSQNIEQCVMLLHSLTTFNKISHLNKDLLKSLEFFFFWAFYDKQNILWHNILGLPNCKQNCGITDTKEIWATFSGLCSLSLIT